MTDQPRVPPYLHTPKHRDVLASRVSIAREALKIHRQWIDRGTDEGCPVIAGMLAGALEALLSALDDRK